MTNFFVFVASLTLTVFAVSIGFAQEDSILHTPESFDRIETLDQLERIRAEAPALAGEVERALENLDEPVVRGAGGQSETRSTRREKAARRIVNGIGTFRHPAAGALLKGSDQGSAKPWCSGTLIGCDTFLTAAHCIASDPVPANYLVFFQNSGFHPVDDIRWPEETFKVPYGDVAVLTLSRPVEGITPVALNRVASPAHGSTGTIVGFGRTGGTNLDFGIKREGTIRTAECKGRFADKKLLCWDFAAEVKSPTRSSNTCNADSGGGLYLQDHGGWKVAGLTGGGSRLDCLAGDHSYDTDVFAHRAWIDGDTLASEKVSAARLCGTEPAIDPDDDIKGTIVRLGAQRESAKFSFTIPAGLGALRVAMNGEDDGKGSNDFNLYLIPGTAAAAGKAVCAEEGNGQFAFCEIAKPRVDRWTILVRRVKGEGRVQVSVTLAPGPTVP